MFLSVGYFQMVKCDKKASSNNVPLEEKASENILSFIWREMENTPHKPHPRKHVYLSLLCLAGTHLSWKAMLTTAKSE